MENYSFLVSVYKNTKVNEFKESMESMINQTVKPEQIVIVFDGAVSKELNDCIEKYDFQNKDLLTLVKLEQNVGLGLALKEGVKHCRNEIVARMDTDDIAVLDRCEKQLKCFVEDSSLSICGSNIAEFIGNTNNIVSYRNVPEKHEDICEYLKSRCPFNHMAVMFKKSEVEKAGGYEHWHYNEDSYLWVRMYLVGCKFYNIQEALVFARINTDTFKRRGGYKYYKSERDLFRFMYKNNVITYFEYLKAKFIRFVVQVMMPNFVRQWFFKKFARS